MFACLMPTAGKQYKVRPTDIIVTNKIEAVPGDKLRLEKVLPYSCLSIDFLLGFIGWLEHFHCLWDAIIKVVPLLHCLTMQERGSCCDCNSSGANSWAGNYFLQKEAP